ncbi:MAG: hypothetical protein K2N94_14015, partial [Lachnospiraceae bacterium]|nr:hypothetical protein [Lachnospiraceae bacterium]
NIGELSLWMARPESAYQGSIAVSLGQIERGTSNESGNVVRRESSHHGGGMKRWLSGSGGGAFSASCSIGSIDIIFREE